MNSSPNHEDYLDGDEYTYCQKCTESTGDYVLAGDCLQLAADNAWGAQVPEHASASCQVAGCWRGAPDPTTCSCGPAPTKPKMRKPNDRP